MGQYENDIKRWLDAFEVKPRVRKKKTPKKEKPATERVHGTEPGPPWQDEEKRGQNSPPTYRFPYKDD